MQRSESIAELATALALAQLEIENASKNAANPHFKSRYADLAEVLNTARPVLAKHGIAVVQSTSYADKLVHVDTLLTHKSGQWLESHSSAPIGKDDVQGVGSVTTYLRRYSLAAMVGIAQEDDDGESAVRPPAQQKPAQPTTIKQRRPSGAALKIAKSMLACEMASDLPAEITGVDEAEAIALSALRAKRTAEISGSAWTPDEKQARAVEWLTKESGG